MSKLNLAGFEDNLCGQFTRTIPMGGDSFRIAHTALLNALPGVVFWPCDVVNNDIGNPSLLFSAGEDSIVAEIVTMEFDENGPCEWPFYAHTICIYVDGVPME